MKLKDLQEQRARTVAAMRQLTENPANAGDLSEEQATQFDQMRSDLAGIEKRIERQAFIDEADRRAQGQTISGPGDDRFDAEVRKFSLTKAIAMQVPDLAGQIDCGREREISTELSRRMAGTFKGIAVPLQVFEKRVITTTAPVGGPGSNIIATDHLGNQYIDRMRSALVINRLGARILSGLVGNVEIPKLKTSATAGWFAENAAIGTSDQEMDKVTMAPKHVGARTEFSRNMLLQSSPDIEELIRSDFAALLAEAIDKAAIKGGGANEPVGILAQSGLNDSISMATPTWAKTLELIAAIQNANAEGTAWLTNPTVVKKLRSTLKVTGDAAAGFIMEGPTTLAGYNAAVTTLAQANGDSPAGNPLIFGNWGDLLVGYWSAFDLLVNPYESTAFSKGNVQVRGIITADVDVRHIESFAAATDITA